MVVQRSVTWPTDCKRGAAATRRGAGHSRICGAPPEGDALINPRAMRCWPGGHRARSRDARRESRASRAL